MKIRLMSLLLLLILVLAACGSTNDGVSSGENEDDKEPPVEDEVDNEATDEEQPTVFPQLSTEVGENEPVVEMTTNMGVIKIKLFPEYAPKAVENFLTHSKDGYYDGVTFHRVINDFMIQGGDPTGTGEGGESIYGKAFEDEFSRSLVNLRGALSMANYGENTNGSQFFIVQNKVVNDSQLSDELPEEIIEAYKENGGTPLLDFKHTVFGQVIEGLEVVDEIAAVNVDSLDKPDEDVIIEKIEVIQE
ncbi:peptidylprolyl isomerase [Jeotgalibacillus marinus]|uniref:Peptidyl-prolyl cis-trans isomerase n=1 Tax=Jeotgalibacillus marinus TaxID=86667 RepID=A0ABV3Q3U9_9BACL